MGVTAEVESQDQGPLGHVTTIERSGDQSRTWVDVSQLPEPDEDVIAMSNEVHPNPEIVWPVSVVKAKELWV